jgi:hypothetical protein
MKYRRGAKAGRLARVLAVIAIVMISVMTALVSLGGTAGAYDDDFYWVGSEVDAGVISSLAYDGTYIYGGSRDGFVVKLDPTDMSEVDRLSGLYAVQDLLWDGSYLYAACVGTGCVLKIDVSTMTEVDAYIAEADVYCLTYDGTYLYAGLWSGPAKVIQINTSDMSGVGTWTCPEWEGSIWVMALTTDGTDIFVAADGPTANCTVSQVNTSTMTTIHWTSATVFSLTYLDGYIYAGMDAESHAPVVKWDIASMTPVGIWYGATAQYTITELQTDGTYIYAGAGNSGTSGIISQIDPSTMTTVLDWDGSGYPSSRCYGLTTGGGYVYASCEWSPAYIYQIPTDTMDTPPFPPEPTPSPYPTATIPPPPSGERSVFILPDPMINESSYSFYDLVVMNQSDGTDCEAWESTWGSGLLTPSPYPYIMVGTMASESIQLARSLLAYDTSSLPEDAIITDAFLRVVPFMWMSDEAEDYNFVLGGTYNASVFPFNFEEGENPPIIYNESEFYGDFGGFTASDIPIGMGEMNTNGSIYFDIDLNNNGVSYINVSGLTVLSLRTEPDINYLCPVPNGSVLGAFFTGDTMGYTDMPKTVLVVDWYIPEEGGGLVSPQVAVMMDIMAILFLTGGIIGLLFVVGKNDGISMTTKAGIVTTVAVMAVVGVIIIESLVVAFK